MGNERGPDRSPSDVAEKLASGAELTVSDVKPILRTIPSAWDYRELEQYRDDVDAAITGELGHAVYASILRDFETAGVLDELRADLIDRSLDPAGFERREYNDRTYYPLITIGEKASEGVGYINLPEKQPTSLGRIQKSILDYLFCTGRGFNLDPEMIYDYETDYREFLTAVVDCTDVPEEYEVTVECDEGDRVAEVRVSLRSDGQAFRRAFEQRSDWLQFAALDPVQEALDREGAQRVRYSSGGNDGWILVVDSETDELVERYV